MILCYTLPDFTIVTFHYDTIVLAHLSFYLKDFAILFSSNINVKNEKNLFNRI